MDVPDQKFVLVVRVSMQKQGADGLGIAAQRRDVDLFLHQRPGATVIQEFVEVESGGKELHDRPVLQEAMNLCRKTKSTLLVSRLSRLSRDAAFVLTLMKELGVDRSELHKTAIKELWNRRQQSILNLI